MGPTHVQITLQNDKEICIFDSTTSELVNSAIFPFLVLCQQCSNNLQTNFDVLSLSEDNIQQQTSEAYQSFT